MIVHFSPLLESYLLAPSTWDDNVKHGLHPLRFRSAARAAAHAHSGPNKYGTRRDRLCPSKAGGEDWQSQGADHVQTGTGLWWACNHKLRKEDDSGQSKPPGLFNMTPSFERSSWRYSHTGKIYAVMRKCHVQLLCKSSKGVFCFFFLVLLLFSWMSFIDNTACPFANIEH